LRGRFPELKIIVLFAGHDRQNERVAARLQQAGADHVVWSLDECRSELMPIVQLLTHSDELRELAASAH
jgi:hypothetical protein